MNLNTEIARLTHHAMLIGRYVHGNEKYYNFEYAQYRNLMFKIDRLRVQRLLEDETPRWVTAMDGRPRHPDTFWLENDVTGAPCFWWRNPWSGKKEKIATLLWPEHPPEATAAVEAMFKSMSLTSIKPDV